MLETTRQILEDLTRIGIKRSELSVRAKKNRFGENVTWDIKLRVFDRARRREIACLLQGNRGILADARVGTEILWLGDTVLILFTFGRRTLTTNFFCKN